MLHRVIIFFIISLIGGLVLILGVNIALEDVGSIEDKVINQALQTEILNSYNAEIMRCDNRFTDNSSSWSECIANASINFKVQLLDESHYQELRNQMKRIIEN
jgi:hypothetical protein